MPKLTDLVESKVEHSNRDVCPHCQKRKPTIYVQGRALIRQSGDPETTVGRSSSGPGTTTRTFKSAPGVYLCRQCATEAIERISQVLGVDADGEAR